MMISESDYKELMDLKHQIDRAERSDEVRKLVETLRARLFSLLQETEERIRSLKDLKGAIEEILEDL